MLSLVQSNPPQDLGLTLESVKSDGRPIWNSSKSAKARWIDDDDDNNNSDDDDDNNNGDDDDTNDNDDDDDDIPEAFLETAASKKNFRLPSFRF